MGSRQRRLQERRARPYDKGYADDVVSFFGDGAGHDFAASEIWHRKRPCEAQNHSHARLCRAADHIPVHLRRRDRKVIRQMNLNSWKECSLSDLGEVVGGATPPTGREEYYRGSIGWITPKDLTTLKGRFISRGERSITEEGYNSCSTRMLPKHSVLFSSRAPIGYVAIAAEELCTNQGFKSVVPNGSTDPLFLFYLLKWKTPEIQELGSGTTFREVSGKVMRGVQVCIPNDRKTQERIGAVLGALDDKIELNEQINEKLLAQLQAIFTRYYQRASSKMPVTNLIGVLSGGTPNTKISSYWNGRIPFFTPKDANSPYTYETEKTITEEGLEHCNSQLFPANTVFVTARGTVGKISMAAVPMAMNQSCYALTGRGIPESLVYFYSTAIVDSLKHKASGAVFDAITIRDFATEEIRQLCPEDKTVFTAQADICFRFIQNNGFENLRLRRLRDTLLPRLMSGEIDVSEVEV